MSAVTTSAEAARLPIMLTDLRLPTVKRMWETLAAQSDREGWRAEKLLAMLFEHLHRGTDADRDQKCNDKNRNGAAQNRFGA